MDSNPELTFNDKVNRYEILNKGRVLSAANPQIRDKSYLLLTKSGQDLSASVLSKQLFFIRKYDEYSDEDDVINNTIALMKRRKIIKKTNTQTTKSKSEINSNG